MKFINAEETLWSHGNRSGTINDPFYLDWIGKASAVDDYVAPAHEFKTLGRTIFFYMMGELGITTVQVNNWIARLPAVTAAEIKTKKMAKIAFDNESDFHRDSPLLELLTVAAGLTTAQVDAAWILGEAEVVA